MLQKRCVDRRAQAYASHAIIMPRPRPDRPAVTRSGWRWPYRTANCLQQQARAAPWAARCRTVPNRSFCAIRDMTGRAPTRAPSRRSVASLRQSRHSSAAIGNALLRPVPSQRAAQIQLRPSRLHSFLFSPAGVDLVVQKRIGGEDGPSISVLVGARPLPRNQADDCGRGEDDRRRTRATDACAVPELAAGQGDQRLCRRGQAGAVILRRCI